MSSPGMDAGGLAIDAQNLDRLKLQARQTPDAALQAAAKQFEAVFLNMMLKSMRDATPQDGMLDSEQTQMFTSMLDQQLAESMARRGVGLAEVMVRQLRVNQSGGGMPMPPVGPVVAAVPSAYRGDAQQAFVNTMLPHAEQASRTSGIPAHLIIGQAALESGWGRHEIRMADGSNSYNLFGIKAGKGWQGAVAEVTTTEYHEGEAHQQVERFRAYGSYAEAFEDYARLLADDPRYTGVVGQESAQGFAQALQQAGYATDPRYADKLVGVIGSVRARA